MLGYGEDKGTLGASAVIFYASSDSVLVSSLSHCEDCSFESNIDDPLAEAEKDP